MSRLIDADALKYNIEHAKALYLDEELVFKIIDQTPRAVRPKGKWVDSVSYFGCECYDEYHANCSLCGYQIDTREERGYFNFCPNCGADMRGDTNEID